MRSNLSRCPQSRRRWGKIAGVRTAMCREPFRTACQGGLRRYRCKSCGKTFNAATGAALPSVTAENVRQALAPVIEDDIVLVTDGNSVYPRCARSLGVRHERLNLSAGRRIRGPFHIQTVNTGTAASPASWIATAGSRPNISTTTCAGLSAPSSWRLRQDPAWKPL